MVVKKELIQIPFVGQQYNHIRQNLKAISCNSDDSYHYLSIINLCRYLTKKYEEEFVSADGDYGQMLAVKNASMMSGVGLNIYQLRILLYKWGSIIPHL